MWYTAPTAVRRLMRLGADLLRGYDLPALRFVASVGEPLNPKTVIWGQQALGRPIHHNWWQTETGGIMIANDAAMDIRQDRWASRCRASRPRSSAWVRRTAPSSATATSRLSTALTRRASWRCGFKGARPRRRGRRHLPRVWPGAGADVPARAVMAEMFGKLEGCSRGRGGSMHLFDAGVHLCGGNAIVAGGIPLAVGLAPADRMQSRDRVTACFFGDGAWSVLSDRAQKADLICQPIGETVRGTWTRLTGEGNAAAHER